MVSRVYVCACVLSCFSCVQLFVTLWTVAHQAPLPMGFSRQEYWRGLTCFLPGGLLHPGIQPASLSSLVLAGGFFTTSTTWEALQGLHVDSTLSQAHESFHKAFPFWISEKLRNSHVIFHTVNFRLKWPGRFCSWCPGNPETSLWVGPN